VGVVVELEEVVVEVVLDGTLLLVERPVVEEKGFIISSSIVEEPNKEVRVQSKLVINN
jgi:hypothetical protein